VLPVGYNRHAIPEGTVKAAYYEAMPIGRWVGRAEIIALVDSRGWPESRLLGASGYLHELVGHCVVERKQMYSGSYLWRRTR